MMLPDPILRAPCPISSRCRAPSLFTWSITRNDGSDSPQQVHTLPYALSTAALRRALSRRWYSLALSMWYWWVSNPLLRDFTPSLDPVQLQHHDLVCELRVQLTVRALLVPCQSSLVMIQSSHMVGTVGIEPTDYDLIRIASSPVE